VIPPPVKCPGCGKHPPRRGLGGVCGHCERRSTGARKRTLIDMAGRTAGLLRVERYAGTGRRGKSLWQCVCGGCGAPVAADGYELRRGRRGSCGAAACRAKLRALGPLPRGAAVAPALCEWCNDRPATEPDGACKACALAGSVSGCLTVLRPLGRSLSGAWACRCECGAEVEVWRSTIERGTRTACRCAAGAGVRERPRHFPVRWRGQSDTLVGWAARLGVHVARLYRAVAKHGDPLRALEAVARKAQMPPCARGCGRQACAHPASRPEGEGLCHWCRERLRRRLNDRRRARRAREAAQPRAA
jgi:hypothetical protein